MDDYTDGALTIEIAETDQGIRLSWRGKSNARNPGVSLKPFFERVFDVAAVKGLKVRMHLDALEYFNSSTLSAIIKGVAQARERAVVLAICYDSKVGWQRRSCDALKALEGTDGFLSVEAIQ